MIERGTGRPDQYLLDGKQVPSVTTIIGKFKYADRLLHWAYRQGLAGKDYRATRDRAAFVGSAVHDYAECHINTETWSPRTDQLHITDKVYRAGEAFKEWYDGCGYTWSTTELPLVSRVHKFAGTLDGVVRRGSKELIFDIKTSKKVYTDHLLQLGAYAVLWEEVKKRPVEGGLILRILPGTDDGSEPAKCKVTEFDQQTVAMAAQTFLVMRQLYEMVDHLELLIKKVK